MLQQRKTNVPYRSSQRVVCNILAILIVFQLFGLATWAGIGVVTLLRPSLGHVAHIQHVNGIIVSIGSDQSFTLHTAAGKLLQFTCGSECHVSIPHLWRHLHEQAQTDIYYLEGSDHQLQALYVD